MSSWQRVAARYLERAEDKFDSLKQKVGQRLGSDDPLLITPYAGYGTAEGIYLKGRVLEDEGIHTAEDNDTIWENLLSMYRRFASDEQPGARVAAQFNGQRAELVTDEEGFFDLRLALARQPDPLELWHPVELRLLEPQTDYPVATQGEVLIPPVSARFGVISDMDDTVLHTDATSLLKMARTVFLGNVHTRMPFAGVAAFYRALQAGGGSEAQGNPIFYVSSSPWNLYDLLWDFLDLQGIPEGPLLLRDWGLTETEILPTGHASHKLHAIEQILDFYPDLPFLLIGDSGQEDPEIYAEVVQKYPDRIRAIYIRNVSQENIARPDAIRKLAQEVLTHDSELLLVDDTLAAAQHALEKGWISAAFWDEIVADVNADKAPPMDPELDIVDEEKDRSVQQEPAGPDAADLAGGQKVA